MQNIHNYSALASDHFFNFFISNFLWFILYGFAGFLVACVLSLIAFRKKIFVRKFKLWNRLSKLNYVIIFIFSIGTFMAYGFLNRFQADINQSLTQALAPLIQTQVAIARTLVAEKVKDVPRLKTTSLKEAMDPLLKDYYYVATSDGFIEKTKETIINTVILKLGTETLLYGIEKAIKKGSQSAGQVWSPSEIPQNSTQLLVLLETALKFLQENPNGVEMKNFDQQVSDFLFSRILSRINQMFSSFYLSLMGIYILVFGLIGLEIYIYNRTIKT